MFHTHKHTYTPTPTQTHTNKHTHASEGGKVWAGPAPASGNAKREEGGDKTPKRVQAETDTANEVTEEIPLPKLSRVHNASG